MHISTSDAHAQTHAAVILKKDNVDCSTVYLALNSLVSVVSSYTPGFCSYTNCNAYIGKTKQPYHPYSIYRVLPHSLITCICPIISICHCSLPSLAFKSPCQFFLLFVHHYTGLILMRTLHGCSEMVEFDNNTMCPTTLASVYSFSLVNK